MSPTNCGSAAHSAKRCQTYRGGRRHGRYIANPRRAHPLGEGNDVPLHPASTSGGGPGKSPPSPRYANSRAKPMTIAEQGKNQDSESLRIAEKNGRRFNKITGRGSWIRTNDLQYPKLPRYQAALYPDIHRIACRYTLKTPAASS